MEKTTRGCPRLRHEKARCDWSGLSFVLFSDLSQAKARLLQWTESLFDTVQNMMADVSRSGTDIQGTVKLFTQQYICLYVLKDIIRRFLNDYRACPSESTRARAAATEIAGVRSCRLRVALPHETL